MSVHPVHWHEGMFLTPQHFQTADRYDARQRQLGSQWDHHYNWGLRVIEINADALANNRLVIDRLQARMHDGTLLSFPDDACLPILDLQPTLVRRDRVMIYLALPLEQQNRPNTAADAEDLSARHVIEVRDVADQDTGADQQAIQVLTPRARLLTSADNLAGFDALPIARIRRSDASAVAPMIDEEYVPPLLACDAWLPLHTGVMIRLLDRIERKAQVLAGQVAARRIGFDSQAPGERLLLEQLRLLNEASAVLRIDVRAQGVTPLAAYRELSRVVGGLAIFAESNQPPVLPAYDHDDLAKCFLAARQAIEGLLTAVVEPSYQERPFRADATLLQVDLDPHWLEPGCALYLGVQTSLSGDEVEELLTKGSNIKFGSADLAERLFLLGQAGLEPRRIVNPPRPLPVRRGLYYYALRRDAPSDDWRQVERTLSLAARLSEQLLADDAREPDAVVLDVEGKSATLQMTLFAVQDDASGMPVEEAASARVASTV